MKIFSIVKKFKLIVPVLGLVVIVAVVWAVQVGKIGNQSPASHVFNGTLQSYKDNVLTVRGIYALDVQENTVSQSFKIMQITVIPETKITKTLLMLPTQAELAKTNGRFETDSLVRSDSTVDLATLQEDTAGLGMGIVATTSENIINKDSFTATEINYRVVEYPSQ